jgi:hypothetical protein
MMMVRPFHSLFIGWMTILGITMSHSVCAADSHQLGIDGLYRIGRWTQVVAPLPSTMGNPQDGSPSVIRTRDGDGVELAFKAQRIRSSGQSAVVGYVIPNVESAPLIVRCGDQTIVQDRFPAAGSLTQRPVMVAKETPWVVAIGDPLGMDTLGVNLTRKDSTIAVSRPKSSLMGGVGLPDQALGYDGVDWLLLGSSGIETCKQLSDEQAQAIVTWVRRGGRMLLCLGESNQELLAAAPWIKEILPFEVTQTTSMEPARLEAFTSSLTPLAEFRGAVLPRDVGQIILMGRNAQRANTPFAARYNIGFGTLIVAAMDLDNDDFAQWPDRLSLLKQLLPEVVDRKSDESSPSVQTSYSDLAGQLRACMDQFRAKRSFGFSLLSLCMMGLIAVIGPLDHWVVNRILGRPLLGWLTFPIVAVGISTVLIFQSQARDLPSDEMQNRRLEIVDIDATQNLGRASSIDYLYSHEAVQFDQKLSPGSMLQSISKPTVQLTTIPLGQPGDTFGGIELTISGDQLPMYSVESQSKEMPRRIELSQVPLAPRSSKGLLSKIDFVAQLGKLSAVELRPGSQLLRGELVNPLPVDLLEGRLIYKNWVYLLPTRFAAGARVPSLDTLRQKNFRWQLTRQKAVESTSQSEAWDPSERTSIERLAEMLMYHSAAGGANYTGLQHQPLGFLDMADRLDDERCLLVGRLAEPIVDLELQLADGESIPLQSDIQTFVRVILPVK